VFLVIWLNLSFHTVKNPYILDGRMNLKETSSFQDCSGCHKKDTHYWLESVHSRSATNEIFRLAFKEEPRQWCLGCHAPLYDPDLFIQEERDVMKLLSPLAKEGVNCAVCHVREGKIMGLKNNENSYHEGLNFSNYKFQDFCVGCHEFNFPKNYTREIEYSHEPMQSTYKEFQKTYWYDNKFSCNYCHGKGNAHNLGGASDRKFLKRNVKVSVKMEKVNGSNNYLVKFQIRIPKIGHAFPTGDLFRSVSLEIYSKTKLIKEYTIHKYVRVLDRKTVVDNRLFPNDKKRKGIDSEIQFVTQEKPELCKIVYHYQGRIEANLKKEIAQENLVADIYSGPCSTFHP
jgi:hypothetical protein